MKSSKVKYMMYSICAVLTLIALSVFHRMGTGEPILANHSYLIGMGLPLLWNIKRKDIRNICLTLCILATFLRLGWLGIISIGVTYAIVFIHNKKFLLFWIPFFLVCCLVIFPKVYPRINTMHNDMQNRITYYKIASDKWQNIWFGDGFRSWSKLPETQPAFNKAGKQTKAWLHTVHSDLVQLAFEFGIIATIIVVFLLLLPIGYINISNLLNRTLLASYLCLLGQAVWDFPFHRAITGTFAIWLILMMYKQAFIERGEYAVSDRGVSCNNV